MIWWHHHLKTCVSSYFFKHSAFLWWCFDFEHTYTTDEYTLDSCFFGWTTDSSDLRSLIITDLTLSVSHFWLWTNKLQIFLFSFLEVFEWVQRSNCQKEAIRSSYFYGFNPALTTITMIVVTVDVWIQSMCEFAAFSSNVMWRS